MGRVAGARSFAALRTTKRGLEPVELGKRRPLIEDKLTTTEDDTP
jgi:hypothetical protein